MALWIAALLQADPSIEALCYLARHAERRACPCAPASPGDPGRIVVAFLALGFSHLSRDTYADLNFGGVVRRLLEEIAAGQRDDGLFFPDDPTANAWMAFALTEAYDATGSELWKGPARRAAEAIQGMPACDPDALFWQSLVLLSAGLSANLPAEPPGDSLREIAMREHRLVFIRRHDRKGHQDLRARVAAAWGPLQLQAGCEAGSWKKSVESTSTLVTLMGRFCWPCRRFGNVFGEKK